MDSKYSLTPKLERLIKKLEKRQQDLKDEFEKHSHIIVDNPSLGYFLKQNLKRYRAYDWKYRGVDIRICYEYNPDGDLVNFVWFGTRENFYREVFNYLR